LALWTASTFANPPGRYSQTVLTFDSEREYSFNYDPKEKALVLELQKTTPAELSHLNHYDESVLRRVIVRDLGGSTVEVRMVMRDAGIRVSVTDFSEPFRIVIDMFDDGFRQKTNPVTGMPELNGQSIVKSGNLPDEPAGQIEDHVATPAESHGAATAKSEHGKYRLLQPTPELLGDPSDIEAAANKVEPGLGKSWREYPIYVYRIETAAFEGEPGRQAWLKELSRKGMTAAQSAADYAGKQFDFGHEGRALLAYQQALHQESSLFNRDVLHLWKLAEIHFGQGNLTLADGYYQMLIEKHPDSGLSGFAKIRRLDLAAIRAIRLANTDALNALAQQLDKVAAKTNPELATAIAIRKSFWQSKQSQSASDAQFGKEIPRIVPGLTRSLEINLPKLESSRTAFLASSLILNEMIEAIPGWNERVGAFAGEYFRKFFGPATEPYRTILKDKLRLKLEKNLESQSSESQHASVVRDFEALPDALKSVQKTPTTAWSIAESYRAMGKTEASLKFYEQAATATDPQLRFKAQFWLGLSAGTLEIDASQSQRGSDRNQLFAKKRSEADDAMRQTWSKMKADEQERTFVAMKDQLELAVRDQTLLRTPPRVILETYSKRLNTKTSSTGSTESSDAKSSFSASSQLVYLASALADKFAKLGLQDERRQAIALLKSVKPSDITDDEQAMKLWSQQLVTLADEYREANNYLEAGRLYAFAGSATDAWEGRAESLFKGGLLLYRAGRRDEAIEAFRKASQDQGNRYYAEMAKERLDKLTE
jgi:hypothetical protein